MAIYSLGVRTSNVTTANPNFEAFTTANNIPRVMELGVFMAAATASVLGLGRPQAIGVTPTTPVHTIAEDPADPASALQTALAWGTAPTIPLYFFRRLNLPGTIGAGIILTFPRGLKIGLTNSIVTWNIGATGVMDLHIVSDE